MYLSLKDATLRVKYTAIATEKNLLPQTERCRHTNIAMQGAIGKDTMRFSCLVERALLQIIYVKCVCSTLFSACICNTWSTRSTWKGTPIVCTFAHTLMLDQRILQLPLAQPWQTLISIGCLKTVQTNGGGRDFNIKTDACLNRGLNRGYDMHAIAMLHVRFCTRCRCQKSGHSRLLKIKHALCGGCCVTFLYGRL